MKKLLKISAFVLLTLNFTSCSSDEPCAPIDCLNDGVSNSNCGCDCPQGYTGTNCSTVLQPSKVIITKVVVKTFNNLDDSGFLWDGTNGADIYIKFNNGTTDVYSHPSYFSNTTGGTNLNYQFTLSPNLQITNVNSPMSVQLWDYDLEDIPPTADDYMGFAVFSPFNGYSLPSVLTVNSDGDTTFDIYLTYQW